MANWNWLDWVLAAIVLVSVITAIWKGLMAELISLGSVVAGVAVAVFNYRRCAPWFEDLSRSHGVALGLSFLLLFFGTLLVGALVSVLVRKAIHQAELEWFDRFLGGVFGLFRGILVDSVLLLILMAFAIKGDAVQNSRLVPYITSGSRIIAMAMPSKVRSDFQVGLEKFKQALTQADQKSMRKKSVNHTNF